MANRTKERDVAPGDRLPDRGVARPLPHGRDRQERSRATARATSPGVRTTMSTHARSSSQRYTAYLARPSRRTVRRSLVIIGRWTVRAPRSCADRARSAGSRLCRAATAVTIVSRVVARRQGDCGRRHVPLGARRQPSCRSSGTRRSMAPDAARPAVRDGRCSRTRHPVVASERTS